MDIWGCPVLWGYQRCYEELVCYLMIVLYVFVRSMKFQSRLSELEVTVDSTYFSKMIRVNLFSKYLSSYAE